MLCNSTSIPSLASDCFLSASPQFFLSEEDVGKNRAEVTAPRLRELAPSIEVNVVTSPLTTEMVRAMNVLIIADTHIPGFVRLFATLFSLTSS